MEKWYKTKEQDKSFHKISTVCGRLFLAVSEAKHYSIFAHLLNKYNS